MNNSHVMTTPFFDINFDSAVVAVASPHLRLVNRRSSPLDFSVLAALENTPLVAGDRSRNVTLTDSDVSEGVPSLKALTSEALKRHRSRLTEWLAAVQLARSDEAKEAVNEIVDNVAAGLFDEATWNSESARHLKVLRGTVKRCAVSKAVNAHLSGHGDKDDLTDAMSALMKQSGDVLEDRLRLFLEGQGVRHWTPEVAKAAEASVVEASEGGGGGSENI